MSGLPSEIRVSHQIAGEFAMLDECQGDWVETEVEFQTNLNAEVHTIGLKIETLGHPRALLG
jgi:hypothetical protein